MKTHRSSGAHGSRDAGTIRRNATRWHVAAGLACVMTLSTAPLEAQERSREGGAASSHGSAVVDPGARRAAMERLAFMVGRWSGDAWAVTGRAPRVELRQTESVRYALGGQVLLVEGVGRRLSDGVPGDTVFHAAATIDWLPERGYLMRSYTLEGRYGEFPVTVSDSGYAWGMDVPGGRVQYRMRMTSDGVFDERGFFILPDGREVQNFAMRLRRVPTH